jgi:TfoX/Sxy family transcriptional regulator of competence genes
MAFDEKLAQRVRDGLGKQAGIVEKKMFGGVTFTLNGNMLCSIKDSDFSVRVGEDQHDAAMKKASVREFLQFNKPVRGTVTVGAAGVNADGELKAWLKQGVDFVGTLPPKVK